VAARGLRYKVIKLDNGAQAFYDLQTDPYESNNLLGPTNNPASLTVPQLSAYTGLTNRLAGWHNPPTPPVVTKMQVQAGEVGVSVPEQLGINYSLLRATDLTAPNWAVVTNYVREVHTNEAVVTVADPMPPAPAFYRVAAQGR
jgi:hypothetical protein